MCLMCLQDNPDIQQWMKAHNISDGRALEQYFVRRVLGLVSSAGGRSQMCGFLLTLDESTRCKPALCRTAGACRCKELPNSRVWMGVPYCHTCFTLGCWVRRSVADRVAGGAGQRPGRRQRHPGAGVEVVVAHQQCGRQRRRGRFGCNTADAVQPVVGLQVRTAIRCTMLTTLCSVHVVSSAMVMQPLGGRP